MKLFAFIGKTLDHVESLTDSLATTTIKASDTAGVYVDTQYEVAKQERTVTLAENILLGKVRLADLKRKLDEAQNGTATTTSSSATDDAEALLNSL